MTHAHNHVHNAMLFDMHCHLDFIANAAEFEALASHCGITSLSNTVVPQAYEQAHDTFAASEYAHIALGAHPWWIANGSIGEAELVLFEQLVGDADFIGEVGLDFSGDRAATKEAQIAAFERILAACDRKLISMHASAAEKELLDALESTGAAARNDCILHWYSGSSDQLTRALDLGCYFSVGKRMLNTKRGREYARVIPLDRLLIESDMPSKEHTHYTPAEWNADLTDAILMIAEARGAYAETVLEAVGATANRLLNR